MATTDFIAAIELGSSKITGVAGKRNSDGSMQLLAYATEDSSSFIRKGIIYNLDKTASSLTSIINKLEASLKNSIGKVYVGIGGQSLRSIRNIVMRTLDEEVIISQDFIDNICDENIECPLINMDILDIIPQEYKVGNNFQVDPVGVASNYVEGHFLNIIARSSIKRNLERTFTQAKIEIADTIISPLATAQAVLTESERRSGCALIDFGADTTTVSIYKNNILRYLSVLPIGGSNITQDITNLRIEEDEAEQLKIAYGNAMYEEDDDTPVLQKLEDGSRSIELSMLNNIIEARAEEIIVNVWNQIQMSGYDDKLLSGIIMTGGTANLKNLDTMLRKKCKIEKVRIARNTNYTIHADNNILKKDGTQNTIFGLLFSGTENCCLIEAPRATATFETPNLFVDDEALKEQEASVAKRKKELEEKQKAEEKIKKEQERMKKKSGPSWIDRLGKLSNSFFNDDDVN